MRPVNLWHGEVIQVYQSRCWRLIFRAARVNSPMSIDLEPERLASKWNFTTSQFTTMKKWRKGCQYYIHLALNPWRNGSAGVAMAKLLEHPPMRFATWHSQSTCMYIYIYIFYGTQPSSNLVPRLLSPSRSFALQHPSHPCASQADTTIKIETHELQGPTTWFRWQTGIWQHLEPQSGKNCGIHGISSSPTMNFPRNWTTLWVDWKDWKVWNISKNTKPVTPMTPPRMIDLPFQGPGHPWTQAARFALSKSGSPAGVIHLRVLQPSGYLHFCYGSMDLGDFGRESRASSKARNYICDLGDPGWSFCNSERSRTPRPCSKQEIRHEFCVPKAPPIPSILRIIDIKQPWLVAVGMKRVASEHHCIDPGRGLTIHLQRDCGGCCPAVLARRCCRHDWLLVFTPEKSWQAEVIIPNWVFCDQNTECETTNIHQPFMNGGNPVAAHPH